MIGLDTNVLVRYIAQDDAMQAQAATEFIELLEKNSSSTMSFSASWFGCSRNATSSQNQRPSVFWNAL